MASSSDRSSQKSLTLLDHRHALVVLHLLISSRLSASNYEWTVGPPKSSTQILSIRAQVSLR